MVDWLTSKTLSVYRNIQTNLWLCSTRQLTDNCWEAKVPLLGEHKMAQNLPRIQEDLIWMTSKCPTSVSQILLLVSVRAILRHLGHHINASNINKQYKHCQIWKMCFCDVLGTCTSSPLHHHSPKWLRAAFPDYSLECMARTHAGH